MLSEKEARILARYEFDPQARAQDAARDLGMKSSTVTYTLRRLQDRGVIAQQCFINSYQLGYIDVAMFFSLVDQSAPQRSELLKRLKEHPRVAYLGSLLGDYHYIVIFLCRSINEIREYLREIFIGAGDVFTDKLIAPRTSVTFFQRKYLDPTIEKSQMLRLEMEGEPIQIDDRDRRILYELGTCRFESLRKLSSNIGEPYSTVERRVRALREAGVIRGFFYRVNPNLVGVQAYRLLVMKKGICSHTREKLFEFCQEHPQIRFLLESIGAWDFEIGLEARDSSDVTAIVESLYGLCGMRIAWVKVLIQDNIFTCRYFPVSPVGADLPERALAS